MTAAGFPVQADGCPEPGEGFPVPSGTVEVELVVQRSRFRSRVGRASSSDEVRAFLADARSAGPDATHHCWAFRIGPPGSTLQIGMSDDGEPHGTAGRPMLEVVLHSGVGDVVAVVSRWFGGTRLGKGGLSRAYAGAVSEALRALPVVIPVPEERATLRLSYSWVDPFLHELRGVGGVVDGARYGEKAVLEVQYPSRARQHLDQVLARLSGGAAPRLGG